MKTFLLLLVLSIVAVGMGVWIARDMKRHKVPYSDGDK